jgi:hypothetical protein
VALGLAVSSLCHGVSDLALAAPHLPRLAHAAALLGPALAGAWWWQRVARASPSPRRQAPQNATRPAARPA